MVELVRTIVRTDELVGAQNNPAGDRNQGRHLGGGVGGFGENGEQVDTSDP